MEIVHNNLKNFIITGIYRPPKGNIKSFKDYCKELLSKKKTSGKNVFIMGDLNINSLDYESNKNPPEKTKIMKRDFTEENIHTFEFLLKNIDWNRFLPLDSPNLANDNFLKIFSDLYDIAFPNKEIEIKTKHLGTPWITKGLQKSSKRKQRSYEKFLKRRTIENENHYKTYKNLFEKIKKNSKKNYYQRKLELNENNIKNTWKVMKEIIGKSKT